MPALLRSRAVLVGLVVGLPLSAFFFCWLPFRNADVREVWSVLTRADVGFAVAAMAAVYTGQACAGGPSPGLPTVSTARFGEMVVSGVAVNNVLPGRVGDLLRAR